MTLIPNSNMRIDFSADMGSNVKNKQFVNRLKNHMYLSKPIAK